MAGKSVERNFAATSHEPSCLPCFHADYMFLGEKDTEGTTPILTLKDDKQYSVFADVVPQKGAHDFVTKQILEDIDTTGFTDIIFKTDNEPAIVAVRNEVKQNRSHKTVPENSIRGQSRSNGFIENANKFVAGKIRTLRSALHTNLNHVINRDHPIITWLVRYAATLISVYHIGKDGKTAYQRRKGKVLNIPIVDFAEKVMYRPLPDKHNKHNKLDAKFYDGIYLGFNQRNSEYYISDEQGKIVGSRTIKRHTIDNRWSYDFVNGVKGVPWDLEGEDVNISLTPEFDEEGMQIIEAKVAPSKSLYADSK